MIVGMIVALAALNLDAEKYPRHLGRRFFRARVLRRLDRSRAVFANIAGGRDEFGGDFVPRFVLVEPIRQISHERVGNELRAVLKAPREDHVAPVTGPVLAELRLGQQFVHDSFPLFRRRIEHERRRVLGRGDVAHDIEPDAS